MDFLFLQDKSCTKNSCKGSNPQSQVNCLPISTPTAIMYDKWQVDWREEKNAFFPNFTAPSRTNLSRVAVSQDILSLSINNDLTCFISPLMQPASISLKPCFPTRQNISCFWEMKPAVGKTQGVALNSLCTTCRADSALQHWKMGYENITTSLDLQSHRHTFIATVSLKSVSVYLIYTIACVFNFQLSQSYLLSILVKRAGTCWFTSYHLWTIPCSTVLSQILSKEGNRLCFLEYIIS